MTDQNKEVSQEQEQPTLEQADALVDENQASEQASQDASDNMGEPVVCHSCKGGNPENDQTVVGSGLRESDVVETGLDPTAALTQESQASDDVIPLTQGERGIDQVIGVLLGEPQVTEQAEDRDQTTEEMEQAAKDAGASSPAAPELVPTVESVLEAILFATDEPLTDSKLAGIVETTVKQVRESIESLNAKYAAENHAFRIEQIAGGYQMLTLNTYNSWLKKMLRARSDNKLSPAAMETLAIIAYKQPIIRADVEAIRGVAVGEVIRSLMYKGLVKITGRAEILGRPMLYGTTKKFLEIFGLNSLKDLPKAEELKNPDRV
jgi:segregation and condensation protein B